MNIVQGDNGIVINFTVQKERVENLEDAVVRVAIKNDKETITKIANIIDAKNGKCEIVLNSNDLSQKGYYSYQWTAYFSDGRIYSGSAISFRVYELYVAVENEDGEETVIVPFASKEELTIHKESSELDHPDNSVTDAKIGDRTIDDMTAPTGDTGKLTTLLGFLSSMIKSITGKSNWRTAPATTLDAVKTHMDNASVHASQTQWDAKANAANPKLTGSVALDNRLYQRFLGLRQTIASSPHQKMRVDIPYALFSGYFDIVVSGNYGNYNMGGKVTKRFNGAFSAGRNSNTFSSNYEDVNSHSAANTIQNNVQISDIKHDAVKDTYYIEISSSLNLPNRFWLGVRIEAFNNTDFSLATFETSFNNITLSEFYPDTVELPKAAIHLKNMSSELVANLNSERINGVKIFKGLTTPVGAVEYDQWNTTAGIKTYIGGTWT